MWKLTVSKAFEKSITETQSGRCCSTEFPCSCRKLKIMLTVDFPTGQPTRLVHLRLFWELSVVFPFWLVQKISSYWTFPALVQFSCMSAGCLPFSHLATSQFDHYPRETDVFNFGWPRASLLVVYVVSLMTFHIATGCRSSSAILRVVWFCEYVRYSHLVGPHFAGNWVSYCKSDSNYSWPLLFPDPEDRIVLSSHLTFPF